MIDVASIMGKPRKGAEKVLGPPVNCEQSKRGPKCNYEAQGKPPVEIVYIKGKADWITVSGLGDVPFSARALPYLGFASSPDPSVANDNVIRYTNIEGAVEVSLFPDGKKVDYAYIKTSTR